MDIKAFNSISYGLYIVSSKHGEKLNGYVANTAFQVTSDPPKLAISCHKENLSSELIYQSKKFSISVLAKDTDPEIIKLIGYKSGNEINKFDKISYVLGENGVPIVTTNAIAYFECDVVDIIDVGSHYLFIGQVVEAEVLNQGDPLTYEYYRNIFKAMSPKHSPTYIDTSKMDKEKEDDETKEDIPEKQRYICQVCGYVYDPELGDDYLNVPPGTSFEDLPDDWVCPICAAAKSDFISEN